ncbi:MAG: PLP-dependent aminotransferase family protein [Sporolactobacillus sp.]
MISPTVSSENRSDYKYRQIYKNLKREILLRHFLPDQKLPSKRELAKSLNVSVNSISGAYQQLLAEGYIYAIERKGFFVEKLDAIPVSENQEKMLNADLIETPRSRQDWLSFSHMSIDRTLFPFDAWMKGEHKALKLWKNTLDDDPATYPQGIYSVRRSISQLLSITRGVKCFPEQIILGSGTQVLIQILSGLFDKNTLFAMEDPGYQRIYHLLCTLNIPVETIKLDKKGISLDDLKQADPKIVYVTPSHQFPTGIVMPISRRIQLLNWAGKQQGRYIIEDDYDSEFKYQTDSIACLQGLDTFNRVIYLGSFSKSLLPGFRLSYMILPEQLLRAARERYSFLMQTCNVLAQITLQQFIDSGDYHKHIKSMRQIYESRRIRLIEEMAKCFGDKMKIYGINAGLHFLAKFETDLTMQEIVSRASDEKLELYSFERCILKENYFTNKPTFIIGFANLPTEQIPLAVQRLHQAIYG